MENTKSTMVKLSAVTAGKTKESAEKTKSQSFEIGHANRLLSLTNSQWKLADEGFKWNGKEIAHIVKKA